MINSNTFFCGSLLLFMFVSDIILLTLSCTDLTNVYDFI